MVEICVIKVSVLINLFYYNDVGYAGLSNVVSVKPAIHIPILQLPTC